MKTTMIRMLATAGALSTLATAAPAFAQASKVATINAADAIFNAKAIGVALQAIDTKYATQMKQADDRNTQLQAQLKPLYDALDTNKDGQLDQAEQQAAVQAQKPQIKQIQDAQTAAQAQIGPLVRPMRLAQIYVFDQLSQRYNTSLDGQIRTKAIGLVIPTSAAIRQSPGVDLTATVRAELDKPLAIDPPANWQPTQEGAGLLQTYEQAVAEAQQRAAQQAAQQQQAQPAGTAPRPAAGATPRPATPAPANKEGGR